MRLVDRVTRLLKETIGLDPASIGSASLERAIVARQQQCGLDDGAYWQRVEANVAERQALIEAVIVPETWFFRERGALSALVEIVQEKVFLGDGQHVVRVVSLPCSTGEEPYSMAMALLSAGIPASRFRIDAVDISAQSLDSAILGVYGRNSFRTEDLAFRDRFFSQIDGRFCIDESVRAQVMFRHGNLFDPALLDAAGTYDAVFCRNVLIYFDRPTQHRAIGILSNLLSPEGILFVGASEGGVVMTQAFAPAGRRMAFAFRRRESTPAPVQRRSRHVPPMKHIPSAKPSTALPPAVRTPQVEAAPAVSSLDEGLRLANAGQFAEAMRLFEIHNAQFGPSEDAFHLLGVVHEASGDRASAATAFRKALYLNPNREDTLMHLALLLESENRMSEATRLRARARRTNRAAEVS